MNVLEYDPNSGDMGIADNITSIESIPLVVSIVSKILNYLKEMTTQDKHFKYCIQVSSRYSKVITPIIEELEETLPIGVKFYSVMGRKVFELRGSSGGVSTSIVFYLIAQGVK